jgi:hypothetical protein
MLGMLKRCTNDAVAAYLPMAVWLLLRLMLWTALMLWCCRSYGEVWM